MDMGFAVGFSINLSHDISVFGNLVIAVGAATGVDCMRWCGGRMAAPAMTAAVDTHQVEFLSWKDC